ncbi:MAG: hypothetical protein RBT24_07335 [Arcobacteraceae bacterium]|nr:hypothetical protein [Arcobacteraceae bacterium]
MFKNILKIVVLGILGFSALVYFTASKPNAMVANDVNGTALSKEALPQNFELVGTEGLVAKEELFKDNLASLIVVGNHDSLAVVKELNRFFELKIPVVMVANISSAPWFVKKMFIPGKLEELNQGSTIPMIYDFDGFTVQALGVTNNEKTAFIAYLLDEKGNINKLFEGKVKEGALDGSMNEEEKKEALLPLVEIINSQE